MDAAKQREIASRGGRAAHAHGTAHKFSSDEARRAGRKGGEAVSGNREHMAAIGRRGGEARQARRAARAASEQQAPQNTPDTAQTGGETESMGSQAANDDRQDDSKT
jgi:general stress protein YciG